MSTQFLLAGIALLLLDSAAYSQDVADRVLQSLFQTDATTFWSKLDQSRPAAVTADFKAIVLERLPSKGEITSLKEDARRKLAGIQQILQLHRRDGVYDVKVFDSPHAFVGLHARSVILISQPALRFLTPEELQAAVAHETGHEYVWTEFEKARARQDFARLQELELFCDAVAIVTLRRAGLNPSSLVSGLEELLRYEIERFEPGKNEARYVSQDERKKFAGKVMKWARVTTPAAR